ncbi:hypothetical protein CIB95_03675 [Lottiidibacillus patelloidae]|uniref:Uncharacterized protein n=1 Tax=Lottiidibacillus patelloidae TaxID=2670334 RepID=A0A263BYD4_9BACI|nr:hypothetical protein [Lottiidibacillus patelloidae]OZM58680.1 hypothetical protein CIB95_03675 [Lottiidibacillus patelloidae]
MNREDRKKKLELLIEKRKAKIKEGYGALFDECIEALGDGVTILSDNKSEELYDLFEENVPFTVWGRIDWEKFKNPVNINDFVELTDLLDSEEEIEIYWSHDKFPVLKAKFDNIQKALDDVIAVSADTFLYVRGKCLVEINREGEITLGYLGNGFFN